MLIAQRDASGRARSDTSVVQESGTFIDNSDGGLLDGIHLLGWGADYPDVTNFLDVHFGVGSSDQFGTKWDDITGPLVEGAVPQREPTGGRQGEEVGDIFLNGKTYDVNVWSTPETRHSLSDIENLLIDTPTGERIQLKDVADVRITGVPNVIAREDQSRKIDVSANVKDRDLGSVAADVEAAVSKIEFPLGYHAEVKGEFQERQAAQSKLLLAGSIAVIAISSMGEPPSDQSEWVCRSPSSCARTSSPPVASGPSVDPGPREGGGSLDG